ncbi:hypothetical protein [Butyrivibrio sp. FC2001]|uniref:hypothetical protein n=1 Tax=Butyrivibrio sp. FC2001 TaxID=1280671 RepID=UPI00047A54ED|nr:hypothetical protein [Butyrivibrio sp. FC2001]
MLICDVLNISPYELLQDSKRLNGGYGWLLTTVPTGEAHWVVIKTDKDNLEIIEIIMRKKAEDHIETCLWGSEEA